MDAPADVLPLLERALAREGLAVAYRVDPPADRQVRWDGTDRLALTGPEGQTVHVRGFHVLTRTVRTW
ncbi:hypothetical protein [Streptomyces pacificus]|uniref:hypothetical protein n=1 Tax=Streptomyces pacificus TaxID=2705029 RepID=UPI0020B114C7|nr:hypothetical protein [Streptomyces pacificus]